MPLARHSLYAQGSQLHIAIWPGSRRLTEDITRFVAKEGRVFVLSASGLLHYDDIPKHLPIHDQLNAGDWYCLGGSAIAGPNGEWLVEPLEKKDGLITATIDLNTLRAERQNFDPTGHYFREDVFQVHIKKQRGLGLTMSEI